MNITTFSFALTAVAVLLGGCAAQKRVDIEIDYASARAKLSAASPSAQNAGSVRAIVTRQKNAVALPSEFDETVSLNRGDIPTLDDLTRRLTRITGLPVRLTREVEDYVAGRSARFRDTSRPPVINPNATAVSFTDDTTVYAMSYNGSKRGLFDAVSARLGCYWRYDKGSVQFFMTDTRTFFIPALPSSSNSKETSKATESAGGSAGGVRSELEVTSTQSIWGELEKTVKSMLTSAGRVVISPANGSLVVTDTPDTLDRVSKYLDDQKRFLSRQVAMEVQVFNLTLSDEASVGVDINLAINHLNKYGITLQSGGSASASTNGSASSSFSLSVLDTATGDAAKFKGSSVIVSALQGQGSISNMRTANLVSLNNHAVPLRVGRTTGYLAQSTVSTTANVGSSTALTPGTIAEGYSLNLLPTILEDDAVLLQLTMNISQLRQLRAIVSGATQIEVPETEDSNTIQRTILKNGETLMLAGFEQDTKSANDTVGILSMGSRGARGRTLLVVLVTPAVSARR
jgi:type IVB pilus formation R64 PilN family outer membrane protein